MEQLSMTPTRRLVGVRAYDRAADAFDAVAWRPPAATRFDGRAANDLEAAQSPDPSIRELISELPAWVTVVAGGVVAALMGVLLGGALHI